MWLMVSGGSFPNSPLRFQVYTIDFCSTGELEWRKKKAYIQPVFSVVSN